MMPPGAGSSSTVEFLRGVWAEVLERRDFGDRDDFFDIGGDSLAVERVAELVEAGTAVELSLETYFDRATIEELAAALDERIARPGPRPPSGPGGRGDG